MHPGAIRHAVLVVTLVLAGAATGQEAVSRGAPPNSPSRETGPVSAPDPKAFEQIVKLWNAKLSEEFLLRKIEREAVVYRLSTEDIIACKAAGVPESIIEAMMKTEGREAPVAVATAPPAAVVPPVPPPTPTPTPTPAAAPRVVPPAPAPIAVPAPLVAPPPPAERSWDGLVRRSPGVVLFRNPWEPGSLSFREGTLSWHAAGDAAKNLALAASAIREHFLVCPKDASSDEACFEWGVKTADAEFRFRDAAWQRKDSPKPREVFAFLEALYPGLATARYRVEKKK